ncbi:MAG: YraN family protein [Pseudomonadota bacterium]
MAAKLGNKQASDRRKKAERRGRRAEFAAIIALLIKGYRISAWRYRTKLGEVDIIARRGTLIAVIEVKARPTVAECVDAVTRTAQSRIAAAADHWLARQKAPHEHSVRYDIMAVCPWRWPEHLEDCW